MFSYRRMMTDQTVRCGGLLGRVRPEMPTKTNVGSLARDESTSALASSAGGVPRYSPEPLTYCAECSEPLYAGFPMRSIDAGAMHVGCYVLSTGRQ
jgi:hypothetical protein